MNLKEIQDNAPEGATHYEEILEDEHYYFKEVGSEKYMWQPEYKNEPQYWKLLDDSHMYMFVRAKELYPIQEPKDPTNPSHYKQGNSHYFIDVSNFKEIDFYVIARLYGITDPNIQHVIKKLLAVGKRNGGKSAKQDIQECIDSLNRKLEIDKLLENFR